MSSVFPFRSTLHPSPPCWPPARLTLRDETAEQLPRLSGFLLGSEPETREEREVGYFFSGLPPWEAAVGWLSPSAEATDGSAHLRWPCLHSHPCWVPQLLPPCPFSSRCVPIVARTLCTSLSFVGSLNPAHTFIKIPFIQTFLK